MDIFRPLLSIFVLKGTPFQWKSKKLLYHFHAVHRQNVPEASGPQTKSPKTKRPLVCFVPGKFCPLGRFIPETFCLGTFFMCIFYATVFLMKGKRIPQVAWLSIINWWVVTSKGWNIETLTFKSTRPQPLIKYWGGGAEVAHPSRGEILTLKWPRQCPPNSSMFTTVKCPVYRVFIIFTHI